MVCLIRLLEMTAANSSSTSSELQRLSETEAFLGGADLWVVKNDPSLRWWSKLDLASAYLLSENFFRAEKEIPSQLIDILEAISLNPTPQSHLKNFVLLGTEDHFLNKWLLVWNNLSDSQLNDSILELSEKMHFNSVRFFSHADSLMQNLATRPSASSLNISFIENA